MERVRLLEELALNALPAALVQALDGWLLRFDDGVMRRTNSVWPNGAGALPLEDRLREIEAFYARRGLPARVQVTCAAQPADLDRELEGRGYTVEAPVSVQCAAAAEVSARASRPHPVEVLPSPSDTWVETAWPDPSLRPEVRRATVRRIGAISGFALARVDGEPAGAAFAVCERGHVGLFAFRTLPAAMRRGVARSILGTLADWALERRSPSLYLQVERDNPDARRLYEGAGFETAYDYHYRTRPN